MTAALAGGEGCGGGAWLPVTCLKDNWPAGPCGWTEQSNRTVWALDSCQSECGLGGCGQATALGPGPREPGL